MPNLIGGVVLGYVWKTLINCFLSIIGQPLLALNSTAGYWGLIILMCWQQIGYMMIVYIAGLQSVPDSVIEAAEIDGAGKWQQTLNVTIPGITPTIITMFILRVGNLMSMGYEKTILLYSSATYETADIISSYIYRVGLQEQSWSYSTAIGLLNSVINCILLVVTLSLIHI